MHPKNYLILLAAGLLLAGWPDRARAQAPAASQEIGNLVVSNIPAIPADLMTRVDQYQNVRGASVADWDREGRGLFIPRGSAMCRRFTTWPRRGRIGSRLPSTRSR